MIGESFRFWWRRKEPGSAKAEHNHKVRSMSSSEDIIRRIQLDGWEKVAQKGSHVQFKHPTKKGRVTIPHPNKDLPKGTVKSILKQAGIAE